MLRRTVLQWIAVAAPFSAIRAWAQTATFPGKNSATLRELAKVVLPSEVSADHVVQQFERWVRDYRPGAEMDHGYGFTRIRAKASSPASNYMAQLDALPEPVTRVGVELAIEQAGIKELPRSPDGKHVASDLMSFYFHSADGNDLCYRAKIERERCRGLDGSENPPPPMKGAA